MSSLNLKSLAHVVVVAGVVADAGDARASVDALVGRAADDRDLRGIGDLDLEDVDALAGAARTTVVDVERVAGRIRHGGRGVRAAAVEAAASTTISC